MIELVSDSLFWFVGDTGGIPERQESVAPYNRLKFVRRELNATISVKLRSILTTEQIETIGGLPDLK